MKTCLLPILLTVQAGTVGQAPKEGRAEQGLTHHWPQAGLDHTQFTSLCRVPLCPRASDDRRNSFRGKSSLVQGELVVYQERTGKRRSPLDGDSLACSLWTMFLFRSYGRKDKVCALVWRKLTW